MLMRLFCFAACALDASSSDVLSDVALRIVSVLLTCDMIKISANEEVCQRPHS